VTVQFHATGDGELDAMSLCHIALRSLNDEAQARVVDYLRARYGMVDPKEAT
jgi:hypothetical protein